MKFIRDLIRAGIFGWRLGRLPSIRAAEFRETLADMDSAERAAVLETRYRRKRRRWILAGIFFSLPALIGKPIVGLLIATLFGWRIYALIRQKRSAEEKDRLIKEFVPLLNEFRLALCQYPLHMLSDDTRSRVEAQIKSVYQLMRRFGLEEDGGSPEYEVATHQFLAEGFRAWKPKTVIRFFLTDLPRDFLHASHLVSRLTPELFRNYLADMRQQLADNYHQVFLQDGHLVFGYARSIPGVAEALEQEPIGIPLLDAHRYRHAYFIGKTGSGKSTLLKNLGLQDMDNGAGVVVISHERDLFHNRFLPAYPHHRHEDLIYFDPSDTTQPVIGFNPFSLETGEDLNLKAGEIYTVFSRAMGDLGVVMKTLLMHAIYALLAVPGSTLKDLARLLDPADDTMRKRVLRVPDLDETTRKFWESYGSSSYYQTGYEPVLNRLAPFFRPPLSVTLSTPSFSFVEQLNRHARVLFCDLSRLRGLMQEVVGQLLIAQLQQTFLARDYLPDLQELIPYFIYIDEFQRYAGHSEEALIDMFNGLRKYQVGLTIAHQTTANISSTLRSTIIGNVGTIGCLQISAGEAAFFAKELQLYESVRRTRGSGIEDVEDAIQQERRRLSQLGASSSRVLTSLQGDLSRARKDELLREDSEPTQSLRPDILQNLEQGHLMLVGLPDIQGCVSLQVPAEPPGLSESFQGTPDEMVSRSKHTYGITKPETSSDVSEEPRDEDYWITK